MSKSGKLVAAFYESNKLSRKKKSGFIPEDVQIVFDESLEPGTHCLHVNPNEANEAEKFFRGEDAVEVNNDNGSQDEAEGEDSSSKGKGKETVQQEVLETKKSKSEVQSDDENNKS